MRKIITSLLILSVSFFSICYAQEKKDIELTISGGPADMGGITGYSIQNDLSAPFHRYFGLSMSLTYSAAYDGIKNSTITGPGAGNMHNETLLSAQFSLYFTPLNTPKHYAYLGGGGGINHHVISISEGTGASYTLDNQIETGIGANLAIGYDHTFEERIVVGIKGMSIHSTDWINMVLIRLGYRL